LLAEDSRFTYGGSAENPLTIYDNKKGSLKIWDGGFDFVDGQISVITGTSKEAAFQKVFEGANGKPLVVTSLIKGKEGSEPEFSSTTAIIDGKPVKVALVPVVKDGAPKVLALVAGDSVRTEIPKEKYKIASGEEGKLVATIKVVRNNNGDLEIVTEGVSFQTKDGKIKNGIFDAATATFYPEGSRITRTVYFDKNGKPLNVDKNGKPIGDVFLTRVIVGVVKGNGIENVQVVSTRVGNTSIEQLVRVGDAVNGSQIRSSKFLNIVDGRAYFEVKTDVRNGRSISSKTEIVAVDIAQYAREGKATILVNPEVTVYINARMQPIAPEDLNITPAQVFERYVKRAPRNEAEIGEFDRDYAEDSKPVGSMTYVLTFDAENNPVYGNPTKIDGKPVKEKGGVVSAILDAGKYGWGKTLEWIGGIGTSRYNVDSLTRKLFSDSTNSQGSGDYIGPINTGPLGNYGRDLQDAARENSPKTIGAFEATPEAAAVAKKKLSAMVINLAFGFTDEASQKILVGKAGRDTGLTKYERQFIQNVYGNDYKFDDGQDLTTGDKVSAGIQTAFLPITIIASVVGPEGTLASMGIGAGVSNLVDFVFFGDGGTGAQGERKLTPQEKIIAREQEKALRAGYLTVEDVYFLNELNQGAAIAHRITDNTLLGMLGGGTFKGGQLLFKTVGGTAVLANVSGNIAARITPVAWNGTWKAAAVAGTGPMPMRRGSTPA
jgi:hypothetical protein